MPQASRGAGLPSSLISDLLVADDDTVYVSTTCGLARSYDFGETWTFVRGMDWADKVRGLRGKPQVEQQGNIGALPREDYITSLAEDEQHRLWLGFRQKEFEVRLPQKEFARERLLWHGVSDDEVKDARLPYVSAILPLGGNRALVAAYGEGLSLAEPHVLPTAPGQAEPGQDLTAAPDEEAAPAGPAMLTQAPPLPSPAKPPTAEELDALGARLEGMGAPLQVGQGAYLGEDWSTQGDWVGRYGSRYALLCASGAPLDHAVINDPSYRVEGLMGPDFPTNSLRHWIQWLSSDNPRVLYNPLLGYRREAEWDDNGETMSMALEGPDVWAGVQVPAGVQRLSLYFFNKDGHSGSNRLRDYLIELKPPAATLESAVAAPTLARARVRDFWGGVYKQFVVKGPGRFWVKVGRNNSFNTILNGVFVDKLTGPLTRWEKRRDPWLGNVRYEWDAMAKPTGQPAAPTAPPSDPSVAAAQQLWAALDTAYDHGDTQSLQGMGRLLAYRAVAAAGWGSMEPPPNLAFKGSSPDLQALLARWRWQMALWTAVDRNEFKGAMTQAYQSLRILNPQLNNVKR